ncbi:s-adenosyl-l-methionine-dependent methyltransferase [Stemphylium lycopersici]|nr:s-adenosyl-l-methionine-dependent methyltransferase [Stemphylium lycopersici]
MPRIPTALIRKAHAIDALLPALLAPCRDLQTAQNELRWLREHIEGVAKARRARGDVLAKGAMLRQLVSDRAQGKPLQYLLGTEYFGELELRCRPGVLIPRADTAASVTHLVSLLRKAHKLPAELRVLDLCTGTGCISLLFQHELLCARDDVDVRILGVDVSLRALKLAAHNLQRLSRNKQLKIKGQTRFIQADVLINPFTGRFGTIPPLKTALNYADQPQFWDILISNPPYISPSAFWKTTTRSVRAFEPKLALVPPPTLKQTDEQQGDLFYPRLLEIARDVEAKVVLLEVADIEQALRIAHRARQLDIFDGIEIWREQPNSSTTPVVENDFAVVGEGNARSVLCWRGPGTSWLGRTATATSTPKDADRLFRSHCATLADVQNLAPPKQLALEPQFDTRLFRENGNYRPLRHPVLQTALNHTNDQHEDAETNTGEKQ